MKRLITVTLIFLTLTASALAEPTLTVSEVREQAAAGWRQTYTAYDRTIAIDLEAVIPEVDAVPVLRIAPRAPQEIPADAVLRWGENDNGEARNEAGVFYYEVRNPMQSPRGIAYQTETHPLAALDDAAAYAVNNPLTLGEVKARTAMLLNDFGFGEFSFDLDRPTDIGVVERGYGLMTGQLVHRDTGLAYADKGYYDFGACQTLRGIPLWRDIEWIFGSFRPNFRVWDLGNVELTVDDAEGGFSLRVRAVEETDVLCEDVPLCPFADVIATLEACVLDGHIRQADQLVFAYMIFRDGDGLAAFPCWVLRCQYLESAAKNPKYGDAMPWLQTDEAKMLVVNAQTGELFDFSSTSRGRSELPEIITWEDVRP